MDHPGPQETSSPTSPSQSPSHPAEGERAKGRALTQRSPRAGAGRGAESTVPAAVSALWVWGSFGCGVPRQGGEGTDRTGGGAGLILSVALHVTSPRPAARLAFLCTCFCPRPRAPWSVPLPASPPAA